MAKAKNQALPGLEDRAIKPLQDAAIEYADIRDARMKLNQQEVDLKAKVRDLMHKHKKKHYAFDGVEITLEPPDGEEKVRVRIKKAQDGDGKTDEED